MSFKQKLLLKYWAVIAFLKSLGAWGVFLIAGIDAAAFGIPMDPLVAGFVYTNPQKTILYCIAASVGSALGSLIPFYLGRAGGELFLLKRIDEQRLIRIRDRFERQEVLAIMIPAMLPPPTPFKLLVFSAGVFEMKTVLFLLAVTAGRLFRFVFLSVLTLMLGQQAVSGTKDLIHNHPAVAVVILVVIVAACFLVYRLLKRPAAEVAKEIEKKNEEAPAKDLKA